MSELLKRIVVSQAPNIIISDLGKSVYLKNSGDSIDLLNRSVNNEVQTRFTLEQVCKSRSLDSLLKSGLIKLYDENGRELSGLSGGSGELSTNLATLQDVANSGIRGWVDYNDLSTQTTPISVLSSTWTQITNDGLGPYSETNYLPNEFGSLLNSNNLDLSSLNIGDNIIIRNDFILTPSVNGTYVTFRIKFGSGSNEFYLTRQMGSLMNGAGIEYPNVIENIFYIGSNDVKNSPVEFQIRCSEETTLVNNGLYVLILGS